MLKFFLFVFPSSVAEYEDKIWKVKRERGAMKLLSLMLSVGTTGLSELLYVVKQREYNKNLDDLKIKLTAERAHLALLKEDEKEMAKRVAEIQKDLQQVEFIPLM